ncbi:MAG: gamma-glutamylcyclotransferase family protein [Candidatus Thorarchaeota archaeon]
MCPQNSNSELTSNLISIVGYGTFITQGYWKKKNNVEVCLIKDFIRIFPKGNWFPYALPCKHFSFWALRFCVLEEELDELDRYEGVDAGLFQRIKISILLKNDRNVNAFMYIPTNDTVKSLNLNFDIDKTDRWKEEIKKIPEVVKKFPELIL